MNSIPDPDLHQIRRLQDDLHRRLSALDERIATLVALAESNAPPLPTAFEPVPPIEEPSPDSLSDESDEPSLPPSESSAQLPPPLPPQLVSVFVHKNLSTPSDPSPAREGLELRVGRYWLVRVGIVVLLTGLVLLGNYAYHHVIMRFGPAGKLALLLLVGGFLSALGAWLDRSSPGLRNYGRVLLAGGAATIYYATYAAHFVAALRVISSPLLGGSLLLLLAGFYAWIAERRKSQRVAVTTVLLSYYTAAINPSAGFTLFSNLLLAALAVFMLLRHRWYALSWLGLAGSYAAYLYWKVQNGGFAGPAETPAAAIGCLFAYWTLFTAAVFAQRDDAFKDVHRIAFLSINNFAFFGLASLELYATNPDLYWSLPAALGVALIALSRLARSLHPASSSFDGACLAQGLLLFSTALVVKFSGFQLALLLAAESTLLLYCTRGRHQPLMKIAASLAAVGGWACAVDAISHHNEGAWQAGVAVAVILLWNAWLFRRLHHAEQPTRLRLLPSFFTTLSLVLGGSLIVEHLHGDLRIFAFVVVALALNASFLVLRTPEFPLIGQLGMMAAWGAWAGQWSAGTMSDTGCAIVLGSSLAMMHVWQWRPSIPTPPALTGCIQSLCALAAVVVLHGWLAPQFDGDNWMVAGGVAGATTFGYALLTRSIPLAAVSQLLTLTACMTAAAAMLTASPAWYLTLAAIALLAAQGSVLHGWSRFAPFIRPHLNPILVGYRCVTFLLGLLWVFDVVAGDWRFLILTLLAALFFVPAAVRQREEFLAYSALLFLVGIGDYTARAITGAPLAAADTLALIIALAVLQAGRRIPHAPALLPANTKNGLTVICLLELWWQSSRWSWSDGSSVTITVVWAGLAFLLMAAGLLLRDRVYRLQSLVILAFAVGHVFVIDVWRMGQFAGILSIIGLAVVLLALGFIYNRFADHIRQLF
jgi:uncharacterized membrane protein